MCYTKAIFAQLDMSEMKFNRFNAILSSCKFSSKVSPRFEKIICKKYYLYTIFEAHCLVQVTICVSVCATFLWITCHSSILHSIFITSSKFTEIGNLYLNFTTLEAASDKNLWKICNETSCTKVIKLYEFILWKLELQYVQKALKT